MDDIKKISAAAEALLFIYGEPVEMKKLSEILGITIENAKIALSDLSDNLKSEGRGLNLIFSGDRVQLVTKPEFFTLIENLVKDEYEENLTPAALETLSIVAYLGPVPRSQIDYFRGVNSTYSLRNLMMRGLIERSFNEGRPHIPLYGASFDLLKHLGLSNVEELPDYDKFKEIIAKAAENGEEPTGLNN